MNHLDHHGILVDYQHGFRKGHSTESQLINTIHEIARDVDKGKQVDAIILDFSKAFDTVPHQRLCQRLDHYGIRSSTLGWISKWLTQRTQCVVVDGESSRDVSVTSGVPQGTVLGPLMFLLYINNIAESTTSSIKLFADDAILFKAIDTHRDTLSLQQDLDKMINWSERWQMRFNAKKCHILRICKKKSKITRDYKIQDTILEPVEHHPYLGIEIQSDLKWNHHIHNTVRRANQTLGFIRRNCGNCESEVKEAAYKILVRPKFK